MFLQLSKYVWRKEAEKGHSNNLKSVKNSTSPIMYLTPEQILSFENDGYLVIEKFWDDTTVDALRARIGTILDTLDLTDPRYV